MVLFSVEPMPSPCHLWVPINAFLGCMSWQKDVGQGINCLVKYWLPILVISRLDFRFAGPELEQTHLNHSHSRKR